MADKTEPYRIDGHKLCYHPERISRWLQGENIYPLYIEIGLHGGCNHRCIYCGLDYLGYEAIALDEEHLKRFIEEAAAGGVKSIMYAGSGEPLLHENVDAIITYTKKNNIDVAVTSNGVLLSRRLAEECLEHLTWLRISLDAANAETYSRIHRTSGDDFHVVMKNLETAVKIRNKNNYTCTIGAQFLLLPQNYTEAAELARELRDMGLDYLIVKPYSQHPLSKNRLGRESDYNNLFHLEETLIGYSCNGFDVIFRRNAMEKFGTRKPYRKCLGIPFWAYLSHTGALFPCIRFLGQDDFCFGTIYRSSFKDLWGGGRRRQIMKRIYEQWDVDTCRRVCRLDEINKYLWDLKNPSQHVNFI